MYICSHCYKFYNRHKFSKGELSDDENDEVTTTTTTTTTEEEEQKGPIQVDDTTKQKEINILQAAQHVEQARAQRLLVNTKIAKARADQ
jgi:hypothetical protein